MEAAKLALPLGFGGGVLMVFSMFLYPRVQKTLGPLKCCQIGLTVIIPSSLLVPIASLFVNTPWAKNAFLYCAIALRSVSKIMSQTSSMIIVNMCAPKVGFLLGFF